jgi:hypothetical protein
MAQKVTINIRKAIAALRGLNSDIQRAIPRALSRSGEKAKEIVINRTARGQGLNGAFKKYSPDYIDFRKSKGRGTKPDLNFSGRMLSNMDVKRVSTNKVIVGFKRKEEEKKAIWNQKSRPFMGIKTGEVSQIEDAFLKTFKRNL